MLTDTTNILQRAFSGSFLLAVSLSSAFAAGKDGPSTYQVEVLIFAVNDAAALARESWPEMYETAGSGQFLYITAAEAGGKAAPAAPVNKDVVVKKPAAPMYQFLGHDQFKLATSIAKLKKNPHYEVLLHTAWRQPAIDLKDETAVFVFDGMTEAEHPVDPLPSADAATGAPTAPPVPQSASETQNFDPHAPRFSGTVKLALGQYLHVALDLYYRKEMSRVGSVDASGKEVLTTHNALQSFHLNEIRRIKTGEVNYFDHPVFGALVLIASAEKNKAGDVEKETVGADSPAPKVMPDD
jgi:hypothetical protein